MARCGPLGFGAPRAAGFLLPACIVALAACSNAEPEAGRANAELSADSVPAAPAPPAWLGSRAAYSRSPGETLRYETSSFASVRVIGPKGDRAVNLDERGVLALTFVARDTARAWYEELAITAISAASRTTPPTDSLVGMPFILLFGPRGRVETLAAPPVPTDSLEIVEPGLVFAGFFLPLPDEALKSGLAWSDSVVRTLPRSPSGTLRLESVGRYRATGDTVIQGQSALAVEYERKIKYGAEGDVAGGKGQAELALEGIEKGRFHFAPEAGRMLGREYSGTLRGKIGPAPKERGGSLREIYEYRGTASLVEGKP